MEEVIEMPSVIEDSYEDEVIADSLVDEIMPEAEEPSEEVEDKDYTSIIDLISDAKDSDEVTSSGSNEDAPDLFSTTSETLNNDTSDNTEAKSGETDDDYLEIPAFLRRQSK